MTFHVPNQWRIRTGVMGSTNANGNNGAFFIPSYPGKAPFKVVASDGAITEDAEAWEHVSVSLPDRTPTWAEMCALKSIFWDDEDTVVQFHPPRSEWVNNHQHCLHMWRPVGLVVPRPPALMVGVASLGVLA